MDRPPTDGLSPQATPHPSLSGALLRFALGFSALLVAAVAMAWLNTLAGSG